MEKQQLKNAELRSREKIRDNPNTKTNSYFVRIDKFHDIGTQDFLTGLIEDHEKMAWMLSRA